MSSASARLKSPTNFIIAARDLAATLPRLRRRARPKARPPRSFLAPQSRGIGLPSGCAERSRDRGRRGARALAPRALARAAALLSRARSAIASARRRDRGGAARRRLDRALRAPPLRADAGATPARRPRRDHR